MANETKKKGGFSPWLLAFLFFTTFGVGWSLGLVADKYYEPLTFVWACWWGTWTCGVCSLITGTVLFLRQGPEGLQDESEYFVLCGLYLVAGGLAFLPLPLIAKALCGLGVVVIGATFVAPPIAAMWRRMRAVVRWS